MFNLGGFLGGLGNIIHGAQSAVGNFLHPQQQQPQQPNLGQFLQQHLGQAEHQAAQTVIRRATPVIRSINNTPVLGNKNYNVGQAYNDFVQKPVINPVVRTLAGGSAGGDENVIRNAQGKATGQFAKPTGQAQTNRQLGTDVATTGANLITFGKGKVALDVGKATVDQGVKAAAKLLAKKSAISGVQQATVGAAQGGINSIANKDNLPNTLRNVGVNAAIQGGVGTLLPGAGAVARGAVKGVKGIPGAFKGLGESGALDPSARFDLKTPAGISDHLNFIQSQLDNMPARLKQVQQSIETAKDIPAGRKQVLLQQATHSINTEANALKAEQASHIQTLTDMGRRHIPEASIPQGIPGEPVAPKGSAYAGPNSYVINPTLQTRAAGFAKQVAEPFLNKEPSPTSFMALMRDQSGARPVSMRSAFEGEAPHPLIGKTVKAGDRGNLGTVTSANADGTLNVRFNNKKEGTTASRAFAPEQLTPLGGNGAKPRLNTTQLVEQARAKVAESQNPGATPVGEPIKPGEQERLYGKHLSQDPTVPTPVQEGLTLGYNSKPNSETMSKAAEHINKQTPDVAAQEINRITGAPTDHQQAVGQLLIRHFIDTNQVEKAIMVANKVAKNSTEAGRAVQILQATGKLTPEGALRDVMNVINKANEKRSPGKQLTLTPEKANEITDLANKVQTLEPGSREHQVAVGLLKKAIEETVPPGFWKKVSSLQTIAQLLNVKTFTRNVLGNAVMNALETTSGVTAAGIDKAISLMGGQRSTVLPQFGAATKGFARGAKFGAQDVHLGIRTSGSLGQTEVQPAMFKSRIFHALEQATGYSLSVPDRAFFQSAFDESIANQMKAQGLTKATAEIQEVASNEALYKTFQNNSKIAQALSKTKKGMNFGKDFGMGDLLLKYPKTPGNILSVGLDYSPVGFVKGLAQFATHIHSLSPSVQREAVMNLSRGITGTGLIAGGAYLASNGIITANANADKDKAAADKFNGEGPFSFNVTALQRLLSGQSSKPQPGDISMNYDWLQPNSMQLSMGANMVLNHKDAQGMINAALDSFDSASSSVTQQPVLTGTSKFFSTAMGSNGQPGSISGALGQAVSGLPASFVPTALNQLGQMTDNTARNTYDPTFLGSAANQIKGKIPLLRQTLDPRIGIDGKDVQQYDPSTGGNNLFNVMLNPAFVTRYKDNPIINEINRLNDATGETTQYPHAVKNSQTIDGKSTKLNSTQLTNFQRTVGQTTMAQFGKIIGSPTYQSASDADKVKILSNALTDINAASKVKAFQQNIVAKSDNPQEPGDLVNYAKALTTDPLTSIDRIFSGQHIKGVTNGAVQVDRMPLSQSSAIKKGLGGDSNSQLDHTVPLEIGGSNSPSNLTNMPKAKDVANSAVENYLGRQLAAGNISKQEAQQKIKDYKDGKLTDADIIKNIDTSKLKKNARSLLSGGDVKAKTPGNKTSTAGLSPADKYKADLASYQENKGKLTGPKDFAAQTKLGKEAITSKYSQDVLDFYGMSKTEAQAYAKANPDQAKDLYAKARQLDSELGGSKYKYGLGKKPKSTKLRVAKASKTRILATSHFTKAKSVKLPKFASLPKPKGLKLAKVAKVKIGKKTTLTA